MEKTKDSETKSGGDNCQPGNGRGRGRWCRAGVAPDQSERRSAPSSADCGKRKIGKGAQTKPKPKRKPAARTRTKSATKKVSAKRPAGKKTSAKRKR